MILIDSPLSATGTRRLKLKDAAKEYNVPLKRLQWAIRAHRLRAIRTRATLWIKESDLVVFLAKPGQRAAPAAAGRQPAARPAPAAAPRAVAAGSERYAAKPSSPAALRLPPILLDPIR